MKDFTPLLLHDIYSKWNGWLLRTTSSTVSLQKLLKSILITQIGRFIVVVTAFMLMLVFTSSDPAAVTSSCRARTERACSMTNTHVDKSGGMFCKYTNRTCYWISLYIQEKNFSNIFSIILLIKKRGVVSRKIFSWAWKTETTFFYKLFLNCLIVKIKSCRLSKMFYHAYFKILIKSCGLHLTFK